MSEGGTNCLILRPRNLARRARCRSRSVLCLRLLAVGSLERVPPPPRSVPVLQQRTPLGLSEVSRRPGSDFDDTSNFESPTLWLSATIAALCAGRAAPFDLLDSSPSGQRLRRDALDEARRNFLD